MEEKQQNNEVNLEKMDQVSGGYAGKDKYTFEQYSEAGVSWEHNIWSKDRYCYKGQIIDQKKAETITDLYFQNKNNKSGHQFVGYIN